MDGQSREGGWMPVEWTEWMEESEGRGGGHDDLTVDRTR